MESVLRLAAVIGTDVEKQVTWLQSKGLLSWNNAQYRSVALTRSVASYPDTRWNMMGPKGRRVSFDETNCALSVALRKDLAFKLFDRQSQLTCEWENVWNQSCWFSVLSSTWPCPTPLHARSLPRLASRDHAFRCRRRGPAYIILTYVRLLFARARDIHFLRASAEHATPLAFFKLRKKQIKNKQTIK